jgi:hypothetical protein
MDDLQQQEARLWDYIDGTCSDTERIAIERLIADHAALRARYQELLELNRLLNGVELEEPSLRFSKNVMEEIARNHIAPAAQSYIDKKVVWGILIFFGTVITAFLAYGFTQVDWSTASSPKSAFGVDLSNVDYSRIFNNNFVNGFMMANVVLALMLFDRYLSNQKKRIRASQHPSV